MQYNRRGPQDAHFRSDGGVNLEEDTGLEAMLTHLPGVVYQLQHHGDGSWLFSYLSAACWGLLGLEAEAVRDRPHLLFDRIVAEDLGEFWRSLQAAEQAQGAWHWQGRFCLPTGEIKWLETTANPQTLPGGTVVWAGLWLDITVRKEAELSTVAAIAAHSPEQRDEWLTILLDNAPLILYTLDTQGRFTFSAGSGLRLLGLQPQQVVGALVYDLYQDCQEALVAVDRALAGEASMATIQVGDVYFENSCIPCRDQAGEVVGMIGVALDISHRKQLEEAQRTQEYQIQRQNQALLDLSKNKVLSSGILEKAFQEMTVVAATTLGIERASIWLFDADRTQLQCQDLYQLSQDCHSQGIELRIEDYPGYFAALEHQATIVASEARTDPSTREFTENYFQPLGIMSLLDSPIQLGGKIVGVVCFEQVGEPRYWSQAEQTFSRSLADIAALALEIHERQRAEREHPLSRAKVVRVAERCGREAALHLEDCDVRCGIAGDDARLELAAVVERDRHAFGLPHDVVVRHDVAVFGEDHAGSRAHGLDGSVRGAAHRAERCHDDVRRASLGLHEDDARQQRSRGALERVGRWRLGRCLTNGELCPLSDGTVLTYAGAKCKRENKPTCDNTGNPAPSSLLHV